MSHPPTDPTESSRDAGGLIPWINTAVCSPRGFAPVARSGYAVGRVRMRPTTQDMAEQVPPDQNGAWFVPRLLGRDDITALRTAPCVLLETGSWPSTLQAAVAVASLSCAGVPVVTTGLPAPVREHVDPDLLRACDMVTSESTRGPGTQEALSIILRRLAHRAYGFSPPGDAQPPRISVVLGTDTSETARLVQELSQQTGVTVHLHLVGAHDGGSAPSEPPQTVTSTTVTPAELGEDIERVGSVYLTHVHPGVSYGPHHLEDLVQALRHSGAALAHSPLRFHYQPTHGIVLEHADEPTETPSPPVGGVRAAATSLWYRSDGPTAPSASGTAYATHGCSAVVLEGGPGADLHYSGVVHRDRPPQLDWFHPAPGAATETTPAPSYFATTRAAARA